MRNFISNEKGFISIAKREGISAIKWESFISVTKWEGISVSKWEGFISASNEKVLSLLPNEKTLSQLLNNKVCLNHQMWIYVSADKWEGLSQPQMKRFVSTANEKVSQSKNEKFCPFKFHNQSCSRFPLFPFQTTFWSHPQVDR